MVQAAKTFEIRRVCATAIDVGDCMVNIAVERWPIAAGESASQVAAADEIS
jgi:hypothetical protein